jgi:hypothetical protein
LSGTEHLTIFRTIPTPHGAPRYATKRWAWNLTLQQWTKVDYDAGGRFEVAERPVANLHDLARLIDKARQDPRLFIVRGELLPEVREAVERDKHAQFRRAKKEGKKGGKPSLAECARHWLMIDVDNYPLPPWGDLADDPAAVVEEAINDLLPECFHDVECFFQLSASAGFKAGVLKAHLFFWLFEPATNDLLRAFFKVHAPGVDTAPYNAAQPHYIADPIIDGGHDPLPRRTGWCKGMETEVCLPAVDLDQLKAALVEKQNRVLSGKGLDPAAVRTIGGALALMGDGDGLSGFHAALLRATFLYARQTPEKMRDDESLKALCRSAIDVAPRAATRSRGELDRYKSDAFLDDLIDGAYVRVEQHKRDAPEGQRPFHEAPGHDVEAARAALRGRLRKFLADARAWNETPAEGREAPRHLGLAIDVGTGKSVATREEVAKFSADLRAVGAPHRVLFLTPTILLGTDAESHFADMPGVSVAIHRGREQPNPKNPGEQMCLDLEAVKMAVTAGLSVETAVCGSGKDGAPACPFRRADGLGGAQCGYFAQQAATAAADVVIAAHEAAFHLPAGVKKNLALTVLDEAWWQDGIKTGRWLFVEGMADAVLANPVLKPVPGGRQVQDDEATDELHRLRTKLEKALMAAPEGYLTRATLEGAGLTASDCSKARGHEWNRKREGLMRPGMALEARKAAAVEAMALAQVPRFAAMWQALGDFLAGEEAGTGRAEMQWREDREGNRRWAICLNLLAEVVEPVKAGPVLLLDATMPEGMVPAYLPEIETPPAIRVRTPHMRVRQVRGGCGKTTLLPDGMDLIPGEDGGPPAKIPTKLAALRDFVLAHSKGDALVITYQGAEAAFLGLPGVEVAHFNNVAGRDEWKNKRVLFVIGRPLPRSDEVRRIAAAITGKPVEVAEPHKESRGVLMRDGSTAAIEVRAYANPAAEAVVQAITQAELIQAAGRLRGVNRTAENPCDLWLFADVVLPLEVDELLDWDSIAPGPVERMACRGIVLTSPADAAKAYPDLFSTPKAAEHAIKRFGLGKDDFPPNSLRILLSKGNGGEIPLKFAYRPPGRGQQTRIGWAAPGSDAEDVWRWLEDRLGELAMFEVVEPPEPDPPASPQNRRDQGPQSRTASGDEVVLQDASMAATGPETSTIRAGSANTALRSYVTTYVRNHDPLLAPVVIEQGEERRPTGG